MGRGRTVGRGGPNVVLVMTDDQGYGDLGRHGNDVLQTPNLDRLYDDSVRFSHFHVSPVCSPTRASLMTGRYNYRTGVVDTYLGRSMMHPDEVTVAEMLGRHGYRTGIFGKWHLGDNYPMRAMDQGFQESLVHHGGGIAQPSDPEFYERKDTYFDPILRHNGVAKRYSGYCTDVFTDAAIAFIDKHRHAPFFVYLATNAPHSPLLIGDTYSRPYLDQGLEAKTAKTYGMITNIDENLGRLFAKLSELGLEDNTLVIFLTDNGPCASQGGPRYNAGLRARKGSVYDGGIHVPCFMRWPARLEAGKEVDRIAAHIDLLPTILDACGVPASSGIHLDGTSLLPLAAGQAADWPDRTLYFQWHRGDEPEPYTNCAARSQRYKLLNGKELYDMAADPAEKNDVAPAHPGVVARMRAGYEAWFEDVGGTRGYAPPRIHLGTRHENPATLTRQDWRGAKGWSDKDLGYWQVHVARAGNYGIELQFPETKRPAIVNFCCAETWMRQPVRAGVSSCALTDVPLGEGDGRLDAWVEQGETAAGIRSVVVQRS